MRLEKLSKTYETKRESHVVLTPTSFDLEISELVSIVGPSGCGKSTLLHMVAGLIAPTSGSVYLDGVEICEPGPERGVVFQSYTLFPWLTVRRNVEFGPRLKRVNREERLELVDRFLKAVELEDYKDYYPKQLSGGMRQRVAIARALVNEPRILLMDEPFGALDAHTRTGMQDLLLAIRKEERTTTLFITHDVDEAVYLSDRIFVMSSSPGRIKAEITVPFGHERTSALRRSQEFHAIRSDVYDLLDADHL